MAEIISKKEIEEIMTIKGSLRGEGIKGYGKYILKERGEEDLEILENELKSIGYPIKFKEIKTMDFYPIGLEALILILLQRVFGFDEKKMEEVGGYEPKTSFLIKLFLRNFVSMEMVAKVGEAIWKEHFTVGKFSVTALDKEKKYTTIRLENFRLHPLHCQTLKGYLSTIVQMVVKSKVECQETKCVYRGDEYHEFTMKWQ